MVKDLKSKSVLICTLQAISELYNLSYCWTCFKCKGGNNSVINCLRRMDFLSPFSLTFLLSSCLFKQESCHIAAEFPYTSYKVIVGHVECIHPWAKPYQLPALGAVYFPSINFHRQKLLNFGEGIFFISRSPSDSTTTLIDFFPGTRMQNSRDVGALHKITTRGAVPNIHLLYLVGMRFSDSTFNPPILIPLH